MLKRHQLTDEQWLLVEPNIPPSKARTGRPRRDPRLIDLPPFNRSTNYVSQAARKGQEVFEERTEKRTTERRGIRRANGSAALNASDLERRPPASPRLASPRRVFDTASLRHGGSAIRRGGSTGGVGSARDGG